jgi:hypothetical protein
VQTVSSLERLSLEKRELLGHPVCAELPRELFSLVQSLKTFKVALSKDVQILF